MNRPSSLLEIRSEEYAANRAAMLASLTTIGKLQGDLLIGGQLRRSIDERAFRRADPRR